VDELVRIAATIAAGFLFIFIFVNGQGITGHGGRFSLSKLFLLATLIAMLVFALNIAIRGTTQFQSHALGFQPRTAAKEMNEQHATSKACPSCSAELYDFEIRAVASGMS